VANNSFPSETDDCVVILPFQGVVPPSAPSDAGKDRLGLGPSAVYSLAPDPAYAVWRGP
jgi:hypothetical protein